MLLSISDSNTKKSHIPFIFMQEGSLSIFLGGWAYIYMADACLASTVRLIKQ